MGAIIKQNIIIHTELCTPPIITHKFCVCKLGDNLDHLKVVTEQVNCQ